MTEVRSRGDSSPRWQRFGSTLLPERLNRRFVSTSLRDRLALPFTHRACDEIGFSRDNDPRLLRVLIASQRTITEQDERAFLLLGVLPDQLYTYSNSLLTQFGVSRRGCAGEAG